MMLEGNDTVGGRIAVKNIADLKASFEDWVQQKVQFALAEKQIEVATFFLDALQTYAPVWSGRYVGSIRVTLGHVDDSFLPRHPATEGKDAVRWPETVPPAAGYSFPDGIATVSSLLDYSAVTLARTAIYITNSVPYAETVEGRNGTFELAVGITDATFGGGVTGL